MQGVETQSNKWNFSYILSIIFHPVLMPLYLLLILFGSNIYFQILQPAQKNYIFFVVVAFSLVAPLAMILLARMLNLISKLKITDTKERIVPFALVAVSYSYSAYLLSHIQSFAFDFIRIFMASSSILIFLCAIIYFVWKISAHLVGLGGLMAALYYFGIHFYTDVSYILATISIIAGIIAYARLKLEEHNSAQIYAGFLMGSLGMFILLEMFTF